MADFGSMSADQINASMGLGPGGVGDQSQAFINSMYGPQGFGGQTAAYSALGAAYGRGTGYYGDTGAAAGPDPNDPNNIALYYQLMGRGGGTGYDYGSLYQPQAPAPSPTVSQGPVPSFSGMTGGYQPINQNDPDLIATYYRLMGGGPASFNDRFGNIPPPASDPYNPPVTPPSQPVTQDWGPYFSGITSDAPPSQQRDSIATALMNQPPQTSMNNPSSQSLLGYDPGNGPINQNDPRAIAEYYRLMGGGGGGISNAPAYQGNPYYLPDPMQGQQPVSQGGGLGAPGFGPYGGSSYTGQPGYGLGIGAVGGPVSMDPAFGTSGGGSMFGYGGLTEQGGGDMGARFNQLMQQGGAGAVQADPQLQAEYARLMGGR
jgi:hypothetical protein